MTTDDIPASNGDDRDEDALITDIAPISIVDEMKTSYLDYAMSVIVARALPDVRDGLKPVHRRILYAAHEGGFTPGKAYKKSAKIVGDVMGNYHPHGDSAIYDALVRMAQPWSMRVPLIDGQGNFGSVDPDRPASMRYTEARLAKIAMVLLDDIDKDTVDFQPNYDASHQEPQVLPARYPNLLVNGAGGIAVGMATNIPPHNLGEIIEATLALLDNPDIELEELMEIVPGPDFPTGAMILGRAGCVQAYRTGRGSIVTRSTHIVEDHGKDRRSLVLTSIPYQTGKAMLAEKIALAVREKKIEGVSDMRDESNRDGIRIVLDLKRDAIVEIILNQLWRYTPAQNNFPANMLAIRDGRPETLGLRDILSSFISFREEVITRRCKFELTKTRDRAHILLGLVVAVSNLDKVVAIIRGSSGPNIARDRLLAERWAFAEIAPYVQLVESAVTANTASDGSASDGSAESATDDSYRLSPTQVKAILELRLHRLTALGREDMGNELKQLSERIEELLAILADRAKVHAIIREELEAIRDQYATPRLTIINNDAENIEDEDLIQREEMVVTITLDGYIKRTPLDVFRAQRRGGKGRAGMATKEEDAVSRLFVTSTHTPVLFFTSLGKVYRMKVWRLPEGGPATRGRAMVNLLPLDPEETIAAVETLPEDEETWSDLHIMFATAKGRLRRNSMDAFASIPSNGKFAMRFEEDSADRLIGVTLLGEADDILLASRFGKAIRIAATDVREFRSRTSNGVRGMRLQEGDEVISMSVLHRVGTERQEREAYLRIAPWKTEREENDSDADSDSDLVSDLDSDSDSNSDSDTNSAEELVRDSAVTFSSGDSNSDSAETTADGEFVLSQARRAKMHEGEQFILTVCANGYGKLSSAYEYSRIGRGGQGVVNISNIERNGAVVASFPATPRDQLMLVTDQAKLIRIALDSLRVIGRNSAGVRLFDVAEEEHIVAAALIEESVLDSAEDSESAEQADDEQTSGEARDEQADIEAVGEAGDEQTESTAIESKTGEDSQADS